MKKLKGFGLFFIIAGLIISLFGVAALMWPGSVPVGAGPALAAGVAVAMLGVITLISVHAHKVSFIPEGR